MINCWSTCIRSALVPCGYQAKAGKKVASGSKSTNKVSSSTARFWRDFYLVFGAQHKLCKYPVVSASGVTTCRILGDKCSQRSNERCVSSAGIDLHRERRTQWRYDRLSQD